MFGFTNRFYDAVYRGDVATAKSLIGLAHLDVWQRRSLAYDVATQGDINMLNLLLSRNYPHERTLVNTALMTINLRETYYSECANRNGAPTHFTTPCSLGPLGMVTRKW
jgi:hypothetical protein